MLAEMITSHEAFQDGVLLLVALVSTINALVMALHLRDHKRWREREDPAHQITGALH